MFVEARSHGVGYYSFSKDEEERSKQQANLNKLREETAKQQQMTSEMKKLREKQLAARLKAARNRKRARMGVPPEPDGNIISCSDKIKLTAFKHIINYNPSMKRNLNI